MTPLAGLTRIERATRPERHLILGAFLSSELDAPVPAHVPEPCADHVGVYGSAAADGMVETNELTDLLLGGVCFEMARQLPRGGVLPRPQAELLAMDRFLDALLRCG